MGWCLRLEIRWVLEDAHKISLYCYTFGNTMSWNLNVLLEEVSMRLDTPRRGVFRRGNGDGGYLGLNFRIHEDVRWVREVISSLLLKILLERDFVHCFLTIYSILPISLYIDEIDDVFRSILQLNDSFEACPDCLCYFFITYVKVVKLIIRTVSWKLDRRSFSRCSWFEY